jgi:hypothetical protein
VGSQWEGVGSGKEITSGLKKGRGNTKEVLKRASTVEHKRDEVNTKKHETLQGKSHSTIQDNFIFLTSFSDHTCTPRLISLPPS